MKPRLERESRRSPPGLLVAPGVVLAIGFFLAFAHPGPRAEGPRDELLVLRDASGATRPVETADDWRERRAQIRAGLEAAMGALPESSEEPLRVEVIGTRVFDGYRRHSIRYSTTAARRTSAYLYVPEGIPDGVRRPGIVALHPTHPIGKGVVAGLSTLPNRQCALELARRGYVVIAPDYPSFGDDAHDFDSDPYPSGSILGVLVHRRAVDLLAERADVDADRIGAVGHSLGGHNAIFLAVFDERIKAVVSSCGWTPFHDYYGGDIRGWTSPRYMPRLKDEFGLDPDRVPFDFYEAVAAIAPRVFFSSSPIDDSNFDYRGVEKAILRTREVWSRFGRDSDLIVRYPICGHDFPASVREEAYRTLDRALDRRRTVTRTPSSDGSLYAGLAVVDITPPLGYRMSGYFSERFNEGTTDRLHGRAIYLRQGSERVAIVLCDLIGLSREVSDRARLRASERTGIPYECILVAATHSHTGPLFHGVLREQFHDAVLLETGDDPHEAVDYGDWLAERLADTVSRARDLAEPSAFDVAFVDEPRLSFNRRFHMSDGSVRFNPGKLNSGIVRVAGPIDPTSAVLVLRDPGRTERRAIWTSFALHLDTVGGASYSADYPRWLEIDLRRRFGEGLVSLFAAAPCGDINHIDVTHDRPQKGQEEARRIGTALATSVARGVANASPVRASLRSARRLLDAPLQRVSEEEVAWARDAIQLVGTSKLPFLEQVRAYKTLDLSRREGGTIQLEVQVVRLGESTALVALPGEIFVELGLELRRRSPFANTIVIELANDAPGYIPTRKAFEEGSYETVNSRVAPGVGETLVDTAVELLTELRHAP